LPLFLLAAAGCYWLLFANVSLGEAESFIPAPLGSDALANYGKDKLPGRLRSLSISIVKAVIRDREPEGEDADARAADVSDSLKSPVPTVTPKPGDPTGTPTVLPTATSTPSPFATGTATATVSPSPSASPSRTPTATKTDVPTAGPSATPSNTPVCTAPPYIEIISPLPDQRFTLADELPGQAFAFDPDNVNPLTCSTTPATFPDDDGEGISGDPEVHMKIEWFDGSSWLLVHTELESNDAYCPFGDNDPFCLTHDLSTGQWPGSTPISTGLHRIKAKVLQDDEGVPSGWVSVEFYIDPAPTATPIPPTPTPPPITPAPTPDCVSISLSNFGWTGNDVHWTINNGWPGTIMITEIYVAWPFAANLDRVELDPPNKIWDEDGSSPEETINSDWKGDRTFSSGSIRVLWFKFQNPVQPGDYILDVQFDNACSRSIGSTIP
ncbi:MAG: hypothetical protein J4N82_08040, partial [Chloroflexi bacterium]|nr:hypothetical protein [Chloroflexota bacterium]